MTIISSQIKTLTTTIPKWLWIPTCLWLMTRIGIALIIYISDPNIRDGDALPPDRSLPANIVLDTLGGRYDTRWYLEIASNGYSYIPGEQSSIAFFPLFPLLTRFLAPVVGGPINAGVLVANTSLLLSVIYLYRLVDITWDESIAARSVWYLLIFPVSFFGSSIYTESLFLLTTVATLYHARRGQWLWAGLFGAAASATRSLGIFTALMLVIEYLQQRRAAVSPAARPSWSSLLAVGLVPLGLLAFMIYQYQAFGDALAFAHVQAAWWRVLDYPWNHLLEGFSRPDGGWSRILSGNILVPYWRGSHMLDSMFTLAFLIFGAVLLRQRRWSEGVFVLFGVLIPLSSGLTSMRRYLWVMFPVFILLARWGESTWVDRIIATLFLLCLGLFTVMYTNGYWVA